MLKTKLRLKMTSEQYGECHAIIHSASAAAAGVGAGLAQIPCSDNVVITPIQVGMITALGKVFDIKVTEAMIKTGIPSAVIGGAGRMVSQVLFGWIPGAGNMINASTAAALTEGIGWAMVKEFVG